jgi:transposase-like protein
LKALVKEALDQILQAEMTEFLGAAPGERSAERVGYRAGYYRVTDRRDRRRARGDPGVESGHG